MANHMPCPFCGSDNIAYISEEEAIVCDACLATGPCAGTWVIPGRPRTDEEKEAEAWRLWDNPEEPTP